MKKLILFVVLSLLRPKEAENEPDTVNVTFPTVDIGCECVPFYLCENNTIISDGSSLIDIRILDIPCPDKYDVCCRNNPQEGAHDFPENHDIKGCGKYNPKGIVSNIKEYETNEAYFGEFPWMAAVLAVKVLEMPDLEGKDDQSKNIYLCGGSLIHPSVVLTAAHCVVAEVPNLLKVRVGEWNTKSKSEEYKHQDREVMDVVLHKSFNERNLFNDISLLILSKPVDPSKNIGFICLPPYRSLSIHGTRCLSSGWGKNSYGKQGQYQTVLKRVSLPIINSTQCEQLLQETRLGRHFKLHNSFICAGGKKGIDTCQGDGGSPLVCPSQDESGRFIQSGIVAWGINCGIENIPGVYVNVAHFRNWIDSVMISSNYDISYYSY